MFVTLRPTKADKSRSFVTPYKVQPNLDQCVELENFIPNPDDRFGSLAAPHDSTIPTAAIEGKAVIGFDLTVLAQAKACRF